MTTTTTDTDRRAEAHRLLNEMFSHYDAGDLDAASDCWMQCHRLLTEIGPISAYRLRDLKR